MRKVIMLVGLIAAFGLFSSQAMAKGKKPPRDICQDNPEWCEINIDPPIDPVPGPSL